MFGKGGRECARPTESRWHHLHQCDGRSHERLDGGAALGRHLSEVFAITTMDGPDETDELL